MAGRKRLTLDTDDDRDVLLNMERSIQKGEHPAGGHEAAGAFAGPPDAPSYDSIRRRLYRKYRKYQGELSRLIAEELGLDDIDPERIFAETLAGRPAKQKIEILVRYFEITRENDSIIDEVSTKFLMRGKPLSREELKELIKTLLYVNDIELDRAGITDKLRKDAQKLTVSDQE